MASNPGNEFSERLRTALNDRPSEIRFSELTDFEWDAVEMYGSYTRLADFSPAAREGADIVSRTTVATQEAGDLAVFIKDGETVYYELVRHGLFRFPPGLGRSVVLTPEDAVFGVEYRPDGYRVLTLEE